jgi:hypothetical protein
LLILGYFSLPLERLDTFLAVDDRGTKARSSEGFDHGKSFTGGKFDGIEVEVEIFNSNELKIRDGDCSEWLTADEQQVKFQAI